MTTAIIALSFIFLTQTVSAQEVDLTQGCIKTVELKEIAKKFSQFDRYVNTNKEEVCSAELGSDNYQIATSLELLKNASPDEPAEVSEDAFTYKAIQEKDWWAYFTNRANNLRVDNGCQPNVVAYVYGFSNNGTVYLCRPYFESSRPTQASVLMHEARHFDGHRHVTCTRGNEEGNSGACDNRVTQKGSYAISLQTLVGLARSEGTSATEKILLESEAVYTAFNKFNTIPKLKMTDYMYVSNDKAEVYMWNINENIQPELVATLNEPAVIHNSFNRFTVYPLDTNVEAYRMGRDFGERVANPGLYAVHYNSVSAQERAKYDSISYFGDGGLLADNKLQTLCNGESLATKDLSSIDKFTRIISFSVDRADPALKSHLVADSGDIYTLECQSRNSTRVNVNKTNFNIDPAVASSIVESFTLGGNQFAMLETGKIVELNLVGSTYTAQELSMPLVNEGWVGATPLSVAEIFE